MAACANTGVNVIADSSAAAITVILIELIVASPLIVRTRSIMRHEHAGFRTGRRL
jgi:hypothetical protein